MSKNYTKKCFVLKCDIKKFFDSVNHLILLELIKRKIKDQNFHLLIEEIVGSFTIKTAPVIQFGLFGGETEREREREPRPSAASDRGIPIGNLTSQLFANIYMNKFDQFIKHELKVKYYARYTDDFVVVSSDENYLKDILPKIDTFLEDKLKLKLHPDKVLIRKCTQGVDFLGYIILPHHRQLRTKTKNRIFKKLKLRVTEFKAGLIDETTLNQSLNSFLGVLSHANSNNLRQELLNEYWFWLKE